MRTHLLSRCSLIFITVLALTALNCGKNEESVVLEETTATAETVERTEPVAEETPENLKFGFDLARFTLETGTIRRGQSPAEVLTGIGVPYASVHQAMKVGKDVFDARRIRQGASFTVLRSNEDPEAAPIFVYEPNAMEYIVLDFREPLQVYRDRHPVETVEETAFGVIDSSLLATMYDRDLPAELAYRMSEIFAWSIDFTRLREGDRFQVVYEEGFVYGESIGIRDVKAVYFEHNGEAFYAFAHDAENGREYYDENGKNLRRAFLKAPVEYSRISSRYTRRRFHPVQKRYKAHLGTDYAAPTGTPIRSVADGVVTEARYGKYNGRYVKIRHNKTYTTQYLHMSRIAKGMRPGTTVKQGRVIGYVGSTGLANGPHVCFRFWKNGHQVDPFTLDLPSGDPLPQASEAEFHTMVAVMRNRLDGVDPAPEREARIVNPIFREALARP